MLSLLLLTALGSTPQQPPTDLEAVLRAEQARVEVMARVAPSVCSVMSLDAPGGGSGVIFDSRGFVLTNFHVVGNPRVERMKIGLPDGRLYPARVLGIDPGSDLAVLLLDPRDGGDDWPHAELGDSDSLLVGQQVFAMGNPFLLATDFRPTTSWGIVSGTHRYQPGPGNRALVYPDCIQVDVPINPGNSGGPLFDMRGQVVGINGRIALQQQRGRVNVGVGFAIASNQVRNFLPDLLAGRHAEHGTLDFNAWFMEHPDGDRSGVFVQAIFEDSKVTDFGLGLGDQLLRFNGTEIHSANQLATLVGVLPAGTRVELAFRPQTEHGFGEERVVEFALPRLDTGSSRDEDRLADEATRRIALEALIAGIAVGVGAGQPAEGATLDIRGAKGEVLVLRRLGRMLRFDLEERVQVRLADGSGFEIAPDGAVSDMSAEQSAQLQRILLCTPWLWRGPQRLERLEGATLLGGVMVGGEPGFRAGLSGEGDMESWYLLDGTPAGWVYDDPLWKVRVETRSTDSELRIIDQQGHVEIWTMAEPSYETPDEGLFRRPR